MTLHVQYNAVLSFNDSLLQYNIYCSILALFCFCRSVLTPLNSLCLQAFAFRPLLFRFLSLSCKDCVSLAVCSLQSKFWIFPSYSAVSNSSSQQWIRWFINPSANVLYWYIHFTFLYHKCFLHAVIYFVHCSLSLILLFYICACCDTRCFKNAVYSCLSK